MTNSFAAKTLCALFVCTLFLFSCDKKEEEMPDLTTKIVGTYLGTIDCDFGDESDFQVIVAKNSQITKDVILITTEAGDSFTATMSDENSFVGYQCSGALSSTNGLGFTITDGQTCSYTGAKQ